jgi:phosphatidylinositol glycan class S
MLALLYFPAEHKYAVYTPLFASAVIPLIGAALRELWAWSRSKKEQNKVTITLSEADRASVES